MASRLPAFLLLLESGLTLRPRHTAVFAALVAGVWPEAEGARPYPRDEGGEDRRMARPEGEAGFEQQQGARLAWIATLLDAALAAYIVLEHMVAAAEVADECARARCRRRAPRRAASRSRRAAPRPAAAPWRRARALLALARRHGAAAGRGAARLDRDAARRGARRLHRGCRHAARRR
jgi:hypothetical protein